MNLSARNAPPVAAGHPWKRLLGLASLWILLISQLHAADPNRLTLVSPHPQEVKAEFGEGFQRWHEARYGTKVTMDWRDLGGSSEIQRFVESEFRAKTNGIGIDIFFGGGPEPFLALADKQWLQPWPSGQKVLLGIPARAAATDVYDEEFRWFGAALSSFGILQNNRVQQQLGLPHVERWEDLAHTNCFRWVGAGDPRSSGSMNNMYEAFLQAFGWNRGWHLLTEIAGNVRQFDRISTTTAKDTSLGQVAYSFAIDYFAFIQIAAVGKNHLEFTLPKDFTAISPDGIAILKGAPHTQTAERFLEFVLGETGQQLWFLPRGHPDGPHRFSIERLSIRPEFYDRYRGVSPIEINPFQLRQTYRYDSRLARKRRDIVRSLFGSILIDVHPELQKAWGSMIARGIPALDRDEFGMPPITEQEALQLAASDAWIKNAEYRTRTKLQWQINALKKYRRLAQSR